MSEIRALEISGMRDLSVRSRDPDRDMVAIRPAAPDEAPDLWSVIGRDGDGRGEVLADLPTRARAFAFARAFRRRLERSAYDPLPIHERRSAQSSK
ncbi:MAG: hypothetical protein AB7P23_11830 [Amphiplicatus sp.]